jgi:1-acyl-sn-glycerol-3-phosphate acyltransferase
MALPPPLRLFWATSYTFKMCGLAMWSVARGAPADRVRSMTKEWAEGLAGRMRIEVTAHGLDAVDWSTPAILMANHQSYLDVLALYRALPTPFGIIAKKALFSVPLFSGVMKSLGCLPVDRGDHGQARDILRDAASKVRAGSTIAVFPEGTRSPGDRIAQLKKGPFHLAQLAAVPVIPIGIRGTSKLMPRNNTGIHPGAVEVHVGAPIPPVSPKGDAARKALMARVRAELARLADVPVMD